MTKEVVTYVQERHPVVKQVGRTCVYRAVLCVLSSTKWHASCFCAHVHVCPVCLTVYSLRWYPDCSMWSKHGTQGKSTKWLVQRSSRLLVIRKDTSLEVLSTMATEICTCE